MHRWLAAFAAPVVEGAQEHAFCLREIIYLRMSVESFNTAALEICCVCVVYMCVTKEVGLGRVRSYHRLALTKILPIFYYCNKGGRGGNILRNIVGNKGGLGGRNCTIMCNNAPFTCRSRTDFFSNTSTHPKSDPKKQTKRLQT